MWLWWQTQMSENQKGAKLSNKQRAFVEHYLICWNASEAARCAGYSRKNANVVGPRLLANVGIKAAIDARLTELQMSADEILVRFTEQARGSMADFVDVNTTTIDLKKAKRARKLHLLKSLTRTVGEFTDTVKIELYDAQQALAHLARIRGMYVDKFAPTDPTGTKEYQPVSAEERARADAELSEWRQKQIETLNSLSAALTRPTSSTPTG